MFVVAMLFCLLLAWLVLALRNLKSEGICIKEAKVEERETLAAGAVVILRSCCCCIVLFVFAMETLFSKLFGTFILGKSEEKEGATTKGAVALGLTTCCCKGKGLLLVLNRGFSAFSL